MYFFTIFLQASASPSTVAIMMMSKRQPMQCHTVQFYFLFRYFKNINGTERNDVLTGDSYRHVNLRKYLENKNMD